jgi:DNA-binding transcriptional MerR regulator
MADREMGEAPQIPEKPFYKIGEVCEYTDTQPYVIRFWESEFPQLAPAKGRSGQRVYRREDIDLILRIKKLLYEEEYTIAGARRRLDEDPEEEGVSSGLSEIRGEATQPGPAEARASMLEELESLRSRLEAAETGKQRAEARVAELVRELERLRDGSGLDSDALGQARVIAAEAAREAAERALDIQRSKALEVADMLEDLVKRLDAERSGTEGDEVAP